MVALAFVWSREERGGGGGGLRGGGGDEVGSLPGLGIISMAVMVPMASFPSKYNMA